jgi:hypothetical protein
MQIDFHHAVTYVAARIAGFKHEDAEIIACAAQYVDDTTRSGSICFTNKAMYYRINSAHRMLDLKNLDDAENHLVWLPFHFLPGNGNLPAETALDAFGGKFIDKLVCYPDSIIAREMVAAAIADRHKRSGLYRLGVTMHVYADTWAHQGFAGVLHEVNDVERPHESDGSGVFNTGLGGFLDEILDEAVPPLGHARANVLPDMPFLRWKYRNGKNEKKSRNNTELFCQAADAMCRAMQEYRRADDPTVEVTGLGEEDMIVVRDLFTSLKKKEGEDRHAFWLQTIAAGRFSFGPAEIAYAVDGKNSWKALALGTGSDLPEHDYKETFLSSDWKLFHDALQAHRIAVLHEILPRFGICAG